MEMATGLSLAPLLRLLWPDDAQADVQRWYQQGFVFQLASAFPLGLVQRHGGPCGVLAVVQAELLRRHLFVHHRPLAEPETEVEDWRQQLLSEALASLLFQCARPSRSVHVVVPTSDQSPYEYQDVEIKDVQSENDGRLLAAIQAHLSTFQSPHGVMSFVLSALRSKQASVLRDEMDDPETTLTGAFGHCSQELVNMLLTGRATSNVFDGDVPMGDTGLMLRGVAQRPHIGYLTQLEALRYCHVGSYYKTPEFPIWVIGSASHFSVCFGLSMDICVETTSERLFQRIQRMFKSFDAMETGVMEIGSLSESLRQLGVAQEVLANEYWMARLLGRLEIPGAGIVLWDEYWKVISVLLHTNDLELALGDTSSVVSSGSQEQRARSDSDLARELQAQFDAEDGGTPNTPEPTASIASTPAQSAEQQWVDFELHYYNGLGSSHEDQDGTQTTGGRRPQLTKCRLTIPMAKEFIGQSTPIAVTDSATAGAGVAPLEEILRTRWPAARIDWLGHGTPSID